jgi:hypothetical protein
MPNTLIHVAIHSAVLIPLRVPLAVVLAGCVIPDVPWIARRLVEAGDLALPQIELFAYFLALASFFGCIALCMAFAVLFDRWKFVFVTAALGCLVHLLVDSMQDKWGVGVHLLAPIDWRASSLASLPIESTVTYMLTVAGILLFIFLMFRVRNEAKWLTFHPLRMAASGLCVIAYFLIPILVIDDVIASDSRYLQTLRSGDARIGRQIQLDRELLMHIEGAWLTTTHTGETLTIVNPDASWISGAIYSFRAVFHSENELLVSEWKLHSQVRDVASYVGLLLTICWFTLLLIFKRRNQRGRKSAL